MIGDLRAQVAAGWSGSRELVRLATEFGLDTLRAHADEIMRRTEAGMRVGIAALPDGEYHEEMEMEIEGIAEAQTLAVTVRIEGSDVYADFTGTAAQVRRPVNCPINYTRAYVALPLKLVCDPILPNNQGTYEPLHLSVPEGTLLNPTFPAACFWRLSAGMLVSELMFRVLSRIAPDRVPADSGSMPTWQFYVNGVRPNGEAFALHQHAFGGMGGRPGDDGLASVSFPYNVRDVSIEWSEMETPVLYTARELIPDSGGAGRVPGRTRSGADSAGVRRAGEEGRAAGAVGLGGADALSPAGARRRRGRLVRGDRGERGGDCAFEFAERDVSGGERRAFAAAGWWGARGPGTAAAGAHRGGSRGGVRDAGRGAAGLRVRIVLGRRSGWSRSDSTVSEVLADRCCVSRCIICLIPDVASAIRALLEPSDGAGSCFAVCRGWSSRSTRPQGRATDAPCRIARRSSVQRRRRRLSWSLRPRASAAAELPR